MYTDKLFCIYLSDLECESLVSTIDRKVLDLIAWTSADTDSTVADLKELSNTLRQLEFTSTNCLMLTPYALALIIILNQFEVIKLKRELSMYSYSKKSYPCLRKLIYSLEKLDKRLTSNLEYVNEVSL